MLHSDPKDNARTDRTFFRRHPDWKGKRLQRGTPEAREWNEIHKDVAQNKFNKTISKAVQECPGLEPKVLKSLLVTESHFDPAIVNQYGCAGIAQFGKMPARSVGLRVDENVDERLDPEKAIPAAAKHLKDKASYLEMNAFAKYGMPGGNEYWKFILVPCNT